MSRCRCGGRCVLRSVAAVLRAPEDRSCQQPLVAQALWVAGCGLGSWVVEDFLPATSDTSKSTQSKPDFAREPKPSHHVIISYWTLLTARVCFCKRAASPRQLRSTSTLVRAKVRPAHVGCFAIDSSAPSRVLHVESPLLLEL